MTKGRKYKIESKEKGAGDNSIHFDLDDKVLFVFEGRKMGISSAIICADVPPFSTWQVGDDIEIDVDKTADRKGEDIINDTNIVRKYGSSSTNIITTRGSSSNIVISSGLVNAMGSSQTMDLARHMSRMVDENDKEYELKIEDNTNTRFTYSLICRKQK